MPNFNVNYNIPNGMKVPQVNVYPIINVSQGLKEGTPIVINVNFNVS